MKINVPQSIICGDDLAWWPASWRTAVLQRRRSSDYNMPLNCLEMRNSFPSYNWIRATHPHISMSWENLTYFCSIYRYIQQVQFKVFIISKIHVINNILINPKFLQNNTPNQLPLFHIINYLRRCRQYYYSDHISFWNFWSVSSRRTKPSPIYLSIVAIERLYLESGVDYFALMPIYVTTLLIRQVAIL